MKNVIKWVHISLGFKKLSPEDLVPFASAIANELPTDADVPVANSPITMLVYGQQIADVQKIIADRQNVSSKNLTTEQNTKVSTLVNSTESIAHFVETTANNKYPGLVDKITTIINRIGYEVRQQGTHGARIFEVSVAGEKFVTLHVPLADNAAGYIFQFSPNPADANSWSKYIVWSKTQLTITDLQSGVNYGFRYAVVEVIKGKTSVSANSLEPIWSDTITSIVL